MTCIVAIKGKQYIIIKIMCIFSGHDCIAHIFKSFLILEGEICLKKLSLC